jgi:hypothetical protein
MKRGSGQINQATLIAVLTIVALFNNQSANAFNFATRIEIVEVKTVGISAGDNTKSIIQIKWLAESQPGTSIKSFDVSLEVAYADGAIEKVKTTANGSARSTRFELLTVHLAAGRAAAELRTFKASITANTTETTTKTGSL